jgi:transcription antitermination factor NusG
MNNHVSFLTRRDSSSPNYFAIRVRSRGEGKVAVALRHKGHHVLVPMYHRHLRYTDRIKKRCCALFPGYVFVQMNENSLLSVITTDGVSYIVRSGSSIVPLTEQETRTIQALSNNGVHPVEPCEPLAAGQRVRIVSGVFAGIEGTLEDVSGRKTVVLSVDSLRQAARVVVERDTIRQIDPHLDI